MPVWQATIPAVVPPWLAAWCAWCYATYVMQEVIPAQFMKPLRVNDFLAWLRFQRLDPENKKQLLRSWADRVGIKLTREMVTTAGIERR